VNDEAAAAWAATRRHPRSPVAAPQVDPPAFWEARSGVGAPPFHCNRDRDRLRLLTSGDIGNATVGFHGGSGRDSRLSAMVCGQHPAMPVIGFWGAGKLDKAIG